MSNEKDFKFIADIIDVVYGGDLDIDRINHAFAITAKHLGVPYVWLNLWDGNSSKLFAHYGLPNEFARIESFKHKDCQCADFIKDKKDTFKLYKIKSCKYFASRGFYPEGISCHFTMPVWAGYELIATLNLGMDKEKQLDSELMQLLCKIFNLAISNKIYCQRLENQKILLSRKNKDLETFVSAVSHDMKTPIIAVKGFLNLIQKKHKNGLTKETNRYLCQIEKGIDRIQELVKDLLNLSQVEKVLGKHEKISVDEVLKASLRSISPLIRHRKPKIKVFGKKPILMGNWMAFFQLFTNLIANAIKYTPDDRRPEVKIFFEEKEENWLFTVKDNGIGFDDKEKRRAFEPFTKVKTLPREGSGVGLSIVKRLVEGFGGKIWFESEKGKGTTFYVYLPRLKEENAEGETRTRTGLTPLDPEPSVSANSTTSADKVIL